MTAKEIIIIVAVFVGVIGLTALFFRAVIIGWLARGGGGGSDGTGPDLGPSGGAGINNSHPSDAADASGDGGGDGD